MLATIFKSEFCQKVPWKRAFLKDISDTISAPSVTSTKKKKKKTVLY